MWSGPDKNKKSFSMSVVGHGRFLADWKITFCRKNWTPGPNRMKFWIKLGPIIPEWHRKGQYRSSIIFRVLQMAITWENVYLNWIILSIARLSTGLRYWDSLLGTAHYLWQGGDRVQTTFYRNFFPSPLIASAMRCCPFRWPQEGG